MRTAPGSLRPAGSDLLAGAPEATEHCRALAPLAFPDGLPTRAQAARVADAIWRHLREHPAEEPVAWDPADAAAQRISSAFQRGGLASAFAEAVRGGSPPAPGRPRVTSYREETTG